ncbi:3-deoxy-7-phosphoheptulonate synthase [Vibrio sp. Of7-15]|uniref:3-deoxy-7-phosphoheptulonate synthase n=1 Tax=Vibrio sp. Of7-15 TaxID=2724879 RepID=UPI001EF330AB|nr:3-deoxy-7-phosphoheptulonate synthase [Vibrio sp. Of7-15]MCG7500103.1 3-deoxy-7-phosphoheptulonate synthase [Vibrio sp. Of7-15]
MQTAKLCSITTPNYEKLITPEALKNEHPISSEIQFEIIKFRKTISDIVSGRDNRLMVICGPCSIHDPVAAIDYAHRFKELSKKVENNMFLVMRTYFEKPRTKVGWKGFINDPSLDGACDIEEGLITARKLLIKLASSGVPLATEILDPNISHYIKDLLSWSAIGARTTESQIHREIASGLSMPVGFKNSTNGSVSSALNAIQAASIPHSFVGIDAQGSISLLRSQGNSNGHIILRGGSKPNYGPEDIKECEQELSLAGLSPSIVVDCSHGNSQKDYRNQPIVAQAVVEQIKEGNTSIKGIMLESNINAGNQKLKGSLQELDYGISITDACIDWVTTKNLLLSINQELSSGNIIPSS